MDTATPRTQSALLAATPRRRGPPTSLRINTPSHNPDIVLVQSESSASVSALSSATSDTDSFIFPPPSKHKPFKNMKKLSLTLPSAQSSTNSLSLPLSDVPPTESRRRPSVISLPAASTSTLLRHRSEEDENMDAAPYLQGPVQVIPGIWLGSEDNVCDWRGHMERGIKSILNVAKEVSTVFDQMRPAPPFMSTPDLKTTMAAADSSYFPAHIPSGRPAMNYLKLPWSHGQGDLVHEGFPVAMAFVDEALERGDGVLIQYVLWIPAFGPPNEYTSCQCGVSRSATLVIALVMRAAAQRSPSVPSDVWALKGMQGAYAFVKDKSSAIGPNMSLIYQLLDYERTFNAGSTSPDCSSNSEEEWGRQRLMMDSNSGDDRESVEIMLEAKALDQAMEERLISRKSSASSMGSFNVGAVPPWKSRFVPRKRAGSIASIMTGGSILSEDLVEEDEEQELLGVGGGFDAPSVDASCSSAEPTEDESTTSRIPHDSASRCQPTTSLRQAVSLRVPPSAPHNKTSFAIPPPPATAIRSAFDIPPRWQAKLKSRRRPPPLGFLPPVPSSPVVPVNPSPVSPRSRADTRKPDLSTADLRTPRKVAQKTSRPRPTSMISTPSQTLFVFPPSPTLTTRTPSTMTLTSNASYPFPSMSTPRVSTFKSDGRRRSFIGVPPPSTPTVASSRVDARGWIGANMLK
ncbi:uncharacterized protein FIBRA_03000 [Fibroporia radiculosa]|uniref:Tyrosine-protein phosphatase domain-containing protein n=1 Tax=Fibroporia radiculosa TaxID=599839 RepID=J4G3S2_9APHY|nr:uncharacterized protein FIBRA_03000 [Fibroporia radiculosa]CCM00953.1 predicted protein [Fibroporia radiculosa]